MIKKFYVNQYPLDSYQTKILLSNSNTIIVAGAGSGKTLTIIGKINYLIEYKDIKPEEILVISFTNASVNDLKSKIKYDIPIYTFHKLAMNILKTNCYHFSLCPQNLLKYIIREYLITCSNIKKNNILKFLKFNSNYNNFIISNEFIYFCNFIETFINLFQTSNSSFQNFNFKKFSKNEKEILTIIFEIYKIFLSEKKSSNFLDFDDLIKTATNLVKKTNFNYKYIIIDEFQDTSFIRINLIKEIFNHSKAKIIVVGDDWQSIYRFSGCDLSIFLNFQKIFPNVKQLKLKNTYRNSQELINIAANFVQKNAQQIPKKLISFKNNKIPIIFAPYINPKVEFKKILNHLIHKTNDILILARNNNDIHNYLDKDFKIIDNLIYYKNHTFKFLSVHKSKGLEAEYTIILNCNDSYLGFPNKIENNSITKKFFPNENYKFAEERRLFYVALTRCKESVYLMYDKCTPSPFVSETKKLVKKNMRKITYFK
ncbi:MAG: hypothetical protein E7172_06180 [Firmicutes bacterium]|nr:hypothetical protein [Bacillota bacterium]